MRLYSIWTSQINSNLDEKSNKTWTLLKDQTGIANIDLSSVYDTATEFLVNVAIYGSAGGTF